MGKPAARPEKRICSAAILLRKMKRPAFGFLSSTGKSSMRSGGIRRIYAKAKEDPERPCRRRRQNCMKKEIFLYPEAVRSQRKWKKFSGSAGISINRLR